jgi:hypothetical protein
MADLKLPALGRLLAQLQPGATLLEQPHSLNPLTERVTARGLGWPDIDGLLPWAAQDAQRLGLADASGIQGWAWVTPCHLRVNADHVAMADPLDLQLGADESTALRLAMEPWFRGDGIALHALSTTTWLARGDILRELPTASIERVRDQPVDPWMPRQAQAKALRRLQNEMQMLLYTHPANDLRERAGLPAINSFWLSATGDLPPESPDAAAPPVQLDASLAGAARQDDAAAWLAAWQALDATTLAALAGDEAAPLRLSLCGPLRALTFERGQPGQRGLRQRLRQWWQPVDPNKILASL